MEKKEVSADPSLVATALTACSLTISPREEEPWNSSRITLLAPSEPEEASSEMPSGAWTAPSSRPGATTGELSARGTESNVDPTLGHWRTRR